MTIQTTAQRSDEVGLRGIFDELGFSAQGICMLIVFFWGEPCPDA